MSCLDVDKDYPGMDINLATANTTDLTNGARECQLLCRGNTECNFFTWSSTNRRCYLKSKKSGVSYEAGATSGPKHC